MWDSTLTISYVIPQHCTKYELADGLFDSRLRHFHYYINLQIGTEDSYVSSSCSKILGQASKSLMRLKAWNFAWNEYLFYVKSNFVLSSLQSKSVNLVLRLHKSRLKNLGQAVRGKWRMNQVTREVMKITRKMNYR